MFNVGGGELLVILLIALIVLGPQRLPDAARQVGRVMADIRRISSGFQKELQDAFDVEGADTPRRTEPVPLAGAVAEADGRPEPRPAGAAGTPAPALRDVSAAPDDASQVAPAVADALDEIVGTPVPAAEPSTPSPEGGVTGSPDVPAPPGERAPGSNDRGDERAAS
jgi:sec-independent protein translocase protein TatB